MRQKQEGDSVDAEACAGPLYGEGPGLQGQSGPEWSAMKSAHREAGPGSRSKLAAAATGNLCIMRVSPLVRRVLPIRAQRATSHGEGLLPGAHSQVLPRAGCLVAGGP